MTDLEKEIAAGKAQYEAATGTAKTSPASKEAPAADKKRISDFKRDFYFKRRILRI